MTAGRSVWPRVLLLGDSLTQLSYTAEGCWGSLLSESLMRQCDVIVRGFSGYNSRQCLSACRCLGPASVSGDVATVWLGANDATERFQNVPLDEYRDNLCKIVHYLKNNSGVSHVLLLTPPPVNVAAMPDDMKISGRSEELTARYAAGCQQEAEQLGVPCVNLHSAFLNQSDWKSFLCDGLHLSARGSAMVHDLVLPQLRSLLAKVMPTGMADDDVILPLWRDVSNETPDTDIKAWLEMHPLPE